jgi:hypothetical protein
MMKKMMNTMIRNMSVEEREEMMLTMMPEMMKRVDPKIMMPKMLRTVGDMITLSKVYDFIEKLIKDKELKKILDTKLNSIKENMSGMMSNMMPMMKLMMQGVMPKMMSFMMPMMQQMNKNGDCIMTDMVEQNPEMMPAMGEMMFENCPKMAGKVIPAEKADDFIENVILNLNKN